MTRCWRLSRPTKITDSRSKNFVGESVEVDAIPPDVLRSLVEDCIAQHVDADQLAALKHTEEMERATLNLICEQVPAWAM